MVRFQINKWPKQKTIIGAGLSIFIVAAAGTALTLRSQGQSLPDVITTTTEVKSGTSSVTQFVIEGYSNGTVPNSSTASNNTATKASTPTAPACTKASQPTITPLDLSGASIGLNKQIDSPSYYQIYGYTLDQIRQEALKCHPVTSEQNDALLANTGYVINWRFDGLIGDDERCSATNIKVGVHIHQIYPSWTNTSQASTGVANAWNSFSQYLATHENGHRDLDIQYATTLLGDLQGLTADDCDQLAQQASTAAQQRLASLNQANQQYDTQTKHGQTQGAILGG